MAADKGSNEAMNHYGYGLIRDYSGSITKTGAMK
jgi:hypothetical protein